jgi:hypothetical protein
MSFPYGLLRPIALVSLSLYAQGCAFDDQGAPDVESDVAAVSARALPITGEWALVSWKGHVTSGVGSAVEQLAVDRRFDARARTGLATFDLDADGNGTIAGESRCAAHIPDRGGVPAGSRASNTVTGLYAVVSALWNLVETLRCDPTKPVAQTMRVRQMRGFFGGASRELWANVGVYGEAASVRAADAECEALRGARWLSFGDRGAACVGYADAGARTLKMLVQRPGEIHVQRLVMRRPGDP